MMQNNNEGWHEDFETASRVASSEGQRVEEEIHEIHEALATEGVSTS
jgi:hypothetical protein